MADSHSSTQEEASKAFNKRFTDIVMSAYTTLSFSYGLDLGLFDVLARADDMQTAAEIAEQASCKERYVKEWLDHMVVSDVVQIDETGTRYLLPVSHRETLTSENFMRTLARVLPYASIPHEELVECGKKNGPAGLPFSKVARMFDEIKKDTDDKKTAMLLNFLLKNIPEVEKKIESGVSVCDVGCGLGHAAMEMARRYPNSEITGFDVYEPFIRVAKEKTATSGLQNVNFVTMDAMQMADDWSDKFDVMFISASLHDIPIASKALAEIYRCLKPGGHFSVKEMNIQSNLHESLKVPHEKMVGKMFLPLSLYHCLPASMNVEGSEALGACVGKERLVALLKSCGFQEVTVTVLPEPSSVQFYCKKPEN